MQNENQKRYFVMMMLLFLHFCIANLSLITVLRKDDIFVWTVMNFSSLWPNLTDVTRNKVLLLSNDNRNAEIEMLSLLCFMDRQKFSAIFALKAAITKEHNSCLHACSATRFTNVWTNDNYLTTQVFKMSPALMVYFIWQYHVNQYIICTCKIEFYVSMKYWGKRGRLNSMYWFNDIWKSIEIKNKLLGEKIWASFVWILLHNDVCFDQWCALKSKLGDKNRLIKLVNI